MQLGVSGIGLNWLVRLCRLHFPIWVALGCLLGLLKPSSFNWVTPNYNILGLTLTMLGMGMTLTFADLRGALAMPKELLAGFVLQFSVMPLSVYFVSKLLKLPSYYAAGLILVGCCPGGTASNIVTYIARGNVALSVLMRAASALSAVVGKLTSISFDIFLFFKWCTGMVQIFAHTLKTG
ncbi:probable sodium/metabolite cotransporter BASS1, chloroplastic [Pyrus x bretschneideri]|uniref:probable sodium/metabolite cotransporter BASS1, chloroplastic n=1 Tax=Pyrus x bretschneideri TaxID=225117 RepID=UPI00202E98CB|nr:probable sodium/metabolite cotransporter BASS1, chloroplastic [Pyrus x bretschneideri]